jgi:hypothetical protein
MEDGGLDDPIEPEDSTEVNRKVYYLFILVFFVYFYRFPINVNLQIHIKRKI